MSRGIFNIHCSMSTFLTRTLGLHSRATAYATTALATSFMHPIFTFYYVKIFLERYKIDEYHFQVAQVIYMIWNAINDPLFGYLQDNCDHFLVRSRRHTIFYGAPLWAISFLIPWFPWADYAEGDILCAIHLIVSLCFYDAMFTYVLLANCCVFAESSEGEHDQIRFLQYQNVASLLGSFSLLFCEQVSSHLENYHMFQGCCVVLAILAWQSLWYSGRNAITKYDLIGVKTEQSSNANDDCVASADRSSNESMFRLTWQILTNRNFFWFVLCNLLFEFHYNFLTNFMSIICDALVPREFLPSFLWNWYYGSVYIIPRVLVILSRYFITTVGYYNIYKFIYGATVFMGIAMYFIGYSMPGVFLLYVITDTIITSYASSLVMMPLAEVVEQDRQQYRRKHPMSSMVFGTNALITKPGISLAPMLVVYLLNSNGYSEYKSGTLPVFMLPQLKDTMFTLICFIPIVCGAIQYLLWTRFRHKRSGTIISRDIEA